MRSSKTNSPAAAVLIECHTRDLSSVPGTEALAFSPSTLSPAPVFIQHEQRESFLFFPGPECGVAGLQMGKCAVFACQSASGEMSAPGTSVSQTTPARTRRPEARAASTQGLCRSVSRDAGPPGLGVVGCLSATSLARTKLRLKVVLKWTFGTKAERGLSVTGVLWMTGEVLTRVQWVTGAVLSLKQHIASEKPPHRDQLRTKTKVVCGTTPISQSTRPASQSSLLLLLRNTGTK